ATGLDPDADSPASACRKLLEWSDRPAFLPVAHLPKHPLIAGGGQEVPSHPLTIARSQIGADPIGERQHLGDDGAELFAAVAVDPTLIDRIRRTLLQQRSPHLPGD